MTRQVAFFLLLLSFFNRGSAQNVIKDYKQIADNYVSKYFDTSLLTKIKCNRFNMESIDHRSMGRYFYNENKNKKLLFSSIIFNYSLYDSTLKSNIWFGISLNKKGKIIRDSAILKDVPACIRQVQKCYFISGDSAKTIAIVDSIKFADDLSVYLERNKFDKEYYWIIRGHKPADKNQRNKLSLNVYAESMSSDQERIINAWTGQIISYSQFEHD